MLQWKKNTNVRALHDLCVVKLYLVYYFDERDMQKDVSARLDKFRRGKMSPIGRGFRIQLFRVADTPALDYVM